MDSPQLRRRSLPGWVVPGTALVILALVAGLVLVARANSDRSPKEVAGNTARGFVAALNSHDLDTVKLLSCRAFTGQAKELAESVDKEDVRVWVAKVRSESKKRAQAVVRVDWSNARAGAHDLDDPILLDVEQHAGLWLICGSSPAGSSSSTGS